VTNTRFARVTTILFDAGNTLAFVDLARVSAVLDECGASTPTTRLERAEAAGRLEMYRRSEADPALRDRDRWDTYVRAIFAAAGLDRHPGAERIRRRLFEVHAAENLWRHVPPGVPATLDRLRARGKRLGVVSNADGRVPDLLAEIGLAHFFETIVDSHLVGVEKPDPRIFALALDRLRVPAADALYVGDFHHVDVVGAERAGLLPVLLDPLGAYRHVECAVIRRLDELEGLLDGADADAR